MKRNGTNGRQVHPRNWDQYVWPGYLGLASALTDDQTDANRCASVGL